MCVIVGIVLVVLTAVGIIGVVIGRRQATNYCQRSSSTGNHHSDQDTGSGDGLAYYDGVAAPVAPLVPSFLKERSNACLSTQIRLRTTIDMMHFQETIGAMQSTLYLVRKLLHRNSNAQKCTKIKVV
jgi:hypothetical protein